MRDTLIQKLILSITPIKKVTLKGDGSLTLPEIIAVAKAHAPVQLKPSKSVIDRQNQVIAHMTNQVENGTAIYGTTTAYGAQADKVLNQGKAAKRLANATALSEAIIHVDVSTGPAIPNDIVKAAMLLRVNMLLPGFSAIRMANLKLLTQALNANLIPQVGWYGTLGASGDLAHNGRILSMLLHSPHTLVQTNQSLMIPAAMALKQAAIPPATLNPKEGLAFVNGDNFSTAAAALFTHELTHLFHLNLFIAALSIQSLKGSIRNYHPLLSSVRPHPGQKAVSDQLLHLLIDSQLAIQDLSGHLPKDVGKNVQDAYSLRTLPQFFGPSWEALVQIWDTVEINANSVSDNPLWTTPNTAVVGETPYQWVSGGNFLAMHMSEALDRLRKIAIHIVKQNDRHLNRLVNPNLNNGLPPNLSDPTAVSLCAFKGLQTQMGMYDILASSLAIPISTAFGIHEELNQDITSHAMTSAYLTHQVLDLVRLAMATNLIASCQAIDLRGGDKLLSPATQPLYHWLRTHVPYIKKEQALGHYVTQISQLLSDKTIVRLLYPSL